MSERKNYAPGMFDIPEREYHELTYVSNSDLKLVRRSPAHYYAARLDPDRKPEEDTPAKTAGRMLHTLILEPARFEHRFVVLPADAPRRPTPAMINAKNPKPESIAAVEWWNAWNEQLGDRDIIKAGDDLEWRKAAETIRNHPELSAFLEKGYAEKTFIDVCPDTGLVRRCRVDWFTVLDRIGVIVDFKSAEDARPYPFSRSAYNYGYFEQAYYYQQVIAGSGAFPKINEYVFLFAVFEKTPPYALKLYEATEEAMVRASLSIEDAMATIAKCINTNTWPAYSTDIEPVDYPTWAKDPGND